MSIRHTPKEKQVLSDKLKEFRKINNLSQEELARKIRASVFSISRWERGKHYPPASTIELMRILKIL